MAAAIKKYYEDRDKYDLEQLQATTESILRSGRNENCDKNNVTVYEFANTNNNDDVSIKKFKEVREAKETASKFRMEKHTEPASLLMQFFVLFDRYFKACSRNRVSAPDSIPINATDECLICNVYFYIAFLVFNLCTDFCASTDCTYFRLHLY